MDDKVGDLLDAYEDGGKEAIGKLIKEDPSTYFEAMAELYPNKVRKLLLKSLGRRLH